MDPDVVLSRVNIGLDALTSVMHHLGHSAKEMHDELRKWQLQMVREYVEEYNRASPAEFDTMLEILGVSDTIAAFWGDMIRAWVGE